MRRILVVEDDVKVRAIVADVLEEVGLEVVQASHAEYALVSLEHSVPDLILLDLGMPPSSMTGAEFLARVRETPAWARIPVVIVSGLGDVVNPDLLESLRVHASLAKPVNAQQLIRVVREALGDA